DFNPDINLTATPDFGEVLRCFGKCGALKQKRLRILPKSFPDFETAAPGLNPFCTFALIAG
ncbi:MAG TPA: hypothetical protein VK623_08920, partial [Flavobacterium sp.]|nr:hypothetical protein [Flavobacterium sp.]